MSCLQNPNTLRRPIVSCADTRHMKGPRLTDTQSRGMRDGTTGYATGTPCPVKEPRGHAIASGERHRLTAGDRPFDAGVSPVISEILLVAVTVLLAAVVSAYLFGLFPVPYAEEETPEILKIVSISHFSDSGQLTYAGILTVKNVDYHPLENRKHGIWISINGVRQNVVIGTLNSHDFISTNHYGVHLIKGAGPDGDFWEPGNRGVIDLSDKLISPGDLVTVEVYQFGTEKIVSRSELSAPSVFVQ